MSAVRWRRSADVISITVPRRARHDPRCCDMRRSCWWWLRAWNSSPGTQFVQVATAWLKFLGWLVPKPRLGFPFEARLQRWAAALQDRESLSPRTIAKYRWWAQQFLRRRERPSVPLRNLSVVEVDAFLRHLSDRGLSRASLATAAKSLRRFFH